MNRLIKGFRAGRADPVSVRRVRTDRDKKQTILLSVICFFSACVLIALQTTVLGRIRLPLLSPAAPSLGLLLTLAFGFILDREWGGVCGLVTGFFCDATGDGGWFLLPLAYFLLGYVTGAVGRRVLAHNLPSFAVFAAAGALIEAGITVARAALSLRGVPPAVWLLHAILPRMLLTVLFSPILYGYVRLIAGAGERRTPGAS